MIHFITHFDEAYRAQGTAMIKSLFDHCEDFCDVFVLWLGGSKRPPGLEDVRIDVCTLDWFISIFGERLKWVKQYRPWREFCWTLEPAIVDTALKLQQFKKGDIVVYVDADSWFLADPIPAIKSALKDATVGLTPHHFPPEKADKARSVGIYNFGFGAFKINDVSKAMVRSWLDKTIVNCNEVENDQTYLDEWPGLLGPQLIDLPRGFNVGPWQRPEIKYVESKAWIVGETKAGLSQLISYHSYDPLISYHFHEFRRGAGRNLISLNDQIWNRTNYDLHPSLIKHVYEPYEKELAKYL